MDKMETGRLIVSEKVIISTGNIMSINDIIKKPSQNSTQELSEAINFTIKEYKKNSQNWDIIALPNHLKFYSRPNDIQARIQENGINDLKIGLKVFLTNDNETLVKEAIETALSQQLKVNNVTDVIVSFKKSESKDNIEEIKRVWKILEVYVADEKVKELGIADVEENTFRALHEWASIKPNIIQINLSTCCVVPPTLQTFCKENDIKLFTHSDSNNILPENTLKEIFEASLELEWAVRFTIHIKCRGVLTTKGYCLCIRPKLE